MINKLKGVLVNVVAGHIKNNNLSEEELAQYREFVRQGYSEDEAINMVGEMVKHGLL